MLYGHVAGAMYNMYMIEIIQVMIFRAGRYTGALQMPSAPRIINTYRNHRS
jgi:hypothetical protein